MKKISTLMVGILILSFSINIGAGKLKVGGWGAPSTKFTSIGDSNPFSKNNEFAFLIAIRGGVMINNFILGGGAYILANKVPYDCSRTGVEYGDYYNDSDGWGGSETEACNDFKDPDLDFYYLGLLVGYNFQVSEIFKIELLSLFGFGGINGGDYDFLDSGETYNQSFFIYEPEISFLIVPKKFFAIGFNISYRLPGMLPKTDSIFYSAADLSGPSFGFELRFGYFNFKKW